MRAVVFDFDGVILQSVHVKTRAFGELFSAESPDARRRIVDYHLANGGISRFEKFRWAYREVLRRPLSEQEERSLGERFNALVEDGVVRSEWVPGAREFLEAHHEQIPLYVASGTPEPELRRIVEKRDMTRYFRGVHGTPRTKDLILRGIARELDCPCSELVMVGDAGNDLDAALAAGARFIGLVPAATESPFPPRTRVLPDLHSLHLELKEP